MIEIKSNRLVASITSMVKVTIYFAVIFYALNFIYEYIFKYLTFIIFNDYTADLRPLLYLVSLLDTIFEHFFFELITVMLFILIYTLKNRFVFSNGVLYYYEGYFFVKERSIPYENIKELDYDKTLFDTGNIIIRLHEEQKPIIIPYVSKVMTNFEIIKKEIGLGLK